MLQEKLSNDLFDILLNGISCILNVHESSSSSSSSEGITSCYIEPGIQLNNDLSHIDCPNVKSNNDHHNGAKQDMNTFDLIKLLCVDIAAEVLQEANNFAL